MKTRCPGNKGASIDKAVTLLRIRKMTDQIFSAVNGENIMSSPQALILRYMIAEGAEGEMQEVLCNWLRTGMICIYKRNI